MANAVNLTGAQITEATQELARTRLLEVFKKQKQSYGLTQAKLAKLMGLSHQSTVGHYLQGTKALNTAVVLKFAQALSVSPLDIYPELMEPVHRLFLEPVRVPVHHAIKGVPSVVDIQTVVVQENLNPYAVEVDIEAYKPMYAKGSFILCSPRLQITKGTEVFLETKKGGKFIGNVIDTTTTVLVFEESNAANTTMTLHWNEIKTCDSVIGTQKSTFGWALKEE